MAKITDPDDAHEFNRQAAMATVSEGLSKNPTFIRLSKQFDLGKWTLARLQARIPGLHFSPWVQYPGQPKVRLDFNQTLDELNATTSREGGLWTDTKTGEQKRGPIEGATSEGGNVVTRTGASFQRGQDINTPFGPAAVISFDGNNVVVRNAEGDQFTFSATELAGVNGGRRAGGGDTGQADFEIGSGGSGGGAEVGALLA